MVPRTFYIGAVIAGITFVASFVILVWFWRKLRKEQRQSKDLYLVRENKNEAQVG